MPKRVIHVNLGGADVRKAIKELKDYKKRVIARVGLFEAKLSKLGSAKAQTVFNSAENSYVILFGSPTINPTTVDAVKTSSGYKIVANGKDVAFLEFGAGITHGSGYKGEIPDNISGIGEYGKGKGSRPAWGYSTDEGKILKDKSNLVITRGNPPAMAMYIAAKEMRENLVKIAKEVLIDD